MLTSFPKDLQRAGAAAVFVLALAACATLGGTIPPPAPSAAAPDDGTLIGRDAQAVHALYGSPSFVRKETDAELWRYDGEHCAAFFFLYRDGEALRVRHVETLPQGRDTALDADCLARIKTRASAAS